MEDTGAIYQYKIDWNNDSKFELAEYKQTTVYSGASPLDCAVDSEGNLFFVTSDDIIYGLSKDVLNKDEVATGQHWELAKSPKVQNCQALDIRIDNELWWANGANTETCGTLATAEWTGDTSTFSAPSTGTFTITARNLTGGEGRSLVATEKSIFYTSYNLLFEYHPEDTYYEDEIIKEEDGNPTLRVTHLYQPKSISWGDKEVWVADGGSGKLYYLKDDKSPNKAVESDVVTEIDGIKGITLVNGDFAAYVAVAVAMLFF